MSLRQIRVAAWGRRLPTKKKSDEDRRTSICNAISSLLHRAEGHQLTMRKDGYVCVQDLLHHPKLHGITFLTLDDIIKRDEAQSFHLSYEPHHPSQARSWWIRANQGHADLRRILKASEIRMAVHGTTHEAWKLIVKQGLSRMNKEYIHLAQDERGACITNGILDSSQVLIYIDVPNAMQAGVKFYLSSNGNVLTDGNESGFLGPSCFKRVDMIKIKTDQLTTPVRHVREEKDAVT